jgi:hypothetical protein
MRSARNRALDGGDQLLRTRILAPGRKSREISGLSYP